MKIKDILKNNISNEKKLAIGQVLNLSIPELLINKEQELTKKELKKYQKIEKELNKGKPLQYITKKAYFLNKEYYVNKNVLIPRPETEYLVQETNNLIKKHLKNKKIDILDIGTGSGIIAIALKQANNRYRVIGIDISKKALKVAKNNKKRHNTDIKLIKTDLYAKINKKFDVIISNPPYIENNSPNVEQKVKENEPKIALYGGKDGLDYYKRILKDINKVIKEKYIIAFEIGENQGKKIEKIAKEYLPKAKITIKKDLNNYDRYIFIVGDNYE